jgi:protocatechuate 3,4-dioxygenase beta subunit
MPTRFDRRSTLTAIATMGVGAMLPTSARTATQLLTPAQSTGPFYSTGAMRFDDQDFDLVRVSDRVRAAGGEILWLKGRVVSGDDTPTPGARIEIWQTDMNGRYLHTGDRAGHADRDPDFQGFGVSIADADG